MPTLGNKKQMLLNQIKNRSNIEANDLKKLLEQWDDLHIDDFKGCISSSLYTELTDLARDPQEVELCRSIEAAEQNTPQEIESLMKLCREYLSKYPTAPMSAKIRNISDSLPAKLQAAEVEQRRLKEEERMRKAREEKEQREALEWETLDRNDYKELKKYRERHPDTIHMDELDNLSWEITKMAVSKSSLTRYISDWPLGRHVVEANNALNEFQEWDDIKHTGDIFDVYDYREAHSSSPFINDINSKYYAMRDEMLEEMKSNPSEFGVDDVKRIVSYDIFKKWELEDEGLITEESWERLEIDRQLLPNLQDFMVENPYIEAMPDCTDVYLFGTPGTGKTCLLMGLTGANGNNYTLNMRINGGEYAAALQEYAHAGLTPGPTFGSFVTTINGTVYEETRRGKIINHNINLVEMSGEEFATRIAENAEPSLADMGTGATNLMKNNNPKAFFIIVDATKDKVKIEYVERIKDEDGNIIDERIRKKYISQLTILNKFVSLFSLPQNKDIMNKVDAIHFIVTKADVLGERSERGEKARDLLLQHYTGPVEALKALCRQSRRINRATGYNPLVFTFSLGQFYLGDVFSFDKEDSVEIMDIIREITGGTREKTFIDKLKDMLGGGN